MRELERLVSELPVGVAELRIGRVPGHSEWPEPYFEVVPTKPGAARFAGVAISTDLDLTVGEAEREFIGFAKGGNISKGATWQEELGWIWQAVVAGGFTQRHYMDSNGNMIGWAATLVVHGTEVVFRNGRRSERLLGRPRINAIRYEPYL